MFNLSFNGLSPFANSSHDPTVLLADAHCSPPAHPQSKSTNYASKKGVEASEMYFGWGRPSPASEY